MNRVFGLALINVPAAVALTLGLFGFGFLGWLAGCLSGLLIGAIWYRRFRAAAIVIATLVSSVFAPIPVSGFMVGAARTVSGLVSTVSLGKLSSRADGELVQITGAETRPELIGVENTPTSTNVKMDRRDCAVPMVTPEWAPGKPVEHWLVCNGRPAACEALWSQRPIAGNVSRQKVADSEAIGNALNQHQISAPSEVMTVSSSPSRQLDAWVVLAVIVALMLGLNLLMQMIISWAQPGKPEPATNT